MFKSFFQGRYGFDLFSFFLAVLGVMFFQFRYIWVIGVMFLGYAAYRGLSKDTGKRAAELQKFRMLLGNIRQNFFSLGMKTQKFIQPLVGKTGSYISRLKQRKDHVFLNCPKCKKTLRLPKNKGKLQVTCPVCGFQFYKKT